MSAMQFRLATWNCFGMGQGAFDAVTARRAPVPARFLHADVHSACVETDVLCVQELLSHDAQQFFDGFGTQVFPSRFRDHNRPTFLPATFRGSGLGIASRSELKEPGVRHYRKPHVGWDRFARKGTLHVQIALDRGPVIDVLNTHLQAGYDDGAIAVRAAQLLELRALVDEIGSTDRPFVVCGDFNVNGLADARGDDEYKRLAAALPGFDDLGAESDLATFEPHPDLNTLAHAFEPNGARQRLDYVFFRPAAGSRRRIGLTSFTRILDRPLTAAAESAKDAPRAYASDHFGVCASFEYEAE